MSLLFDVLPTVCFNPYFVENVMYAYFSIKKYLLGHTKTSTAGAKALPIPEG